MKKRILLDTNMLIYLLDDCKLDDKVTKITKYLYDSDEYMIVIHPQTFYEVEKIKDARRKEIFKSKLGVYSKIINPPKATKEFNELVGAKNSHDLIDNELLYALKNNCVSYLISNDKELCKKGEKIGLGEKTLSIEEALEKFKEEENCNVYTPIFISKEYLYNMELKDDFFTSLRNDYKGFDKWFLDKKEDWKEAYVTKDKNNKITSFLMLKEEDESENYSKFDKPFVPGKRIKVSTFKVADTGKKIGECFIKIMINEAIEKNVDEIYVTTFEKQDSLIYLLEQYGFKYFTYKNTQKNDETIEKELIYVKNMKEKDGYPYVNVSKQNIFIVPVQPQYHKLLFEEAEKEFQISIDDTLGKNTSANAIKKAFISNSKIKMIRPGDILLFYASQDKKAITALGIVETTWNKFDSQEEISNLVRKRTAYNKNELEQVADLSSLVIMFKHYITFNKPITYKFLYDNKILKGPPQSIGTLKKENLKKIIVEGNSQKMINII